MDKNRNSAYYTMMYGLYFGGGLVVFELVSYLTKVQTKSFFHMMLAGTIWLVIFAGGIIYCASDYRKKHLNNVMTYGNALQFSIMLIFFSSLLVAVFNFILHGIIDTNYINEFMDAAKDNTLTFYDNLDFMDDATLDNLEEKLSEQAVPNASRLAMNTIFSNTVIGLFVSLITSIFVQKKEAIFNNK